MHVQIYERTREKLQNYIKNVLMINSSGYVEKELNGLCTSNITCIIYFSYKNNVYHLL